MNIETVLVANRGEIALRAIRSIKAMGKRAIAVYSSADKDASYISYADASICIGSAKSVDSYLNIPAIISAAEISGADAIFPGYGFLSENQRFAEICEEHKIKFIGPSGETMSMMSDKSNAKDIMKKAGVPVIPGSDGILDTPEEALELANSMGYPVIVKASAGGGGRGMRMVERKEDLISAFLSAQSEAASAFGDGSMYMEKFIQNPRHIEVQVIADAHGNVCHIGERDCSMQRRHQKLIEESPAVILSAKARQGLLDVAVKATKAINYENVGTFEFLVDKNNDYYFMEMNTRLQVEHPVSEMVSGIDIVEWMIRVAEGEKLFSQKSVVLRGHSLECRITAEDPETFMPSPGKITKLVSPGGKDVRFDSHIYGGYSVPPHYDSMIGKLIVWADTRDEAIAKMLNALDEFQIEGIKTSAAFHVKMLKNPDFITNNYDTKYLG
ncbi:MAG: Biotin carboxylase of acetyl-CoA carboxylase (EC [uncultured Campylobacterales bacterium]|uniref:Biotin carboxylase n=1 Tax=uncultured Campylobacterales bacterium TaxID=352960 RepID=A0A6S6TAY3_9BACT|nr:MAG: Biotin carboxylase of acetyl-CoA carboxylase (EC [uncultured Campylobacterales bacterium]